MQSLSLLSLPKTLSLAPGAIAASSRLLGVGLEATSRLNGPNVAAGTAAGSPLLLRHYAVESLPHQKSHPPPTALKSVGSFAAGAVAPHPGLRPAVESKEVAESKEAAGNKLVESYMQHAAYDTEYLESLKPTHLTPEKMHQRIGLGVVRIARWSFDRATGYGPKMTEAKWLQRMIFLETVAGVPGMVGGMLRHLKSLRSMQRDNGWIHTLLEEAENERMHLLTFFQIRQPGPLFRAAVIAAQGLFFNAFFIGYLLSPKTCHAFVGFLEEEAVKTYTHALADIDAGLLWKDKAAPPIAIQYWGLNKDATMRDVILAVRADEACHAHVNHTLSKLKPSEVNPFVTGASQLP
ncbi:Alternative oxidase, mitochondrial [Tetrabaena socialis]|uniref:Ubiquinol oxidase n=1 Tax=Tetrabaena socialis TaxID=47790 RepID=A0A2J8AHV8_9CHLO|nr:Alternative oxidase, mitochondrial [Tetrabaena socialis]|eukprot:PNH12106.1 Alternative oxidase, mitochondrial [Tetrabaena socialis]